MPCRNGFAPISRTWITASAARCTLFCSSCRNQKEDRQSERFNEALWDRGSFRIALAPLIGAVFTIKSREGRLRCRLKVSREMRTRSVGPGRCVEEENASGLVRDETIGRDIHDGASQIFRWMAHFRVGVGQSKTINLGEQFRQIPHLTRVRRALNLVSLIMARLTVETRTVTERRSRSRRNPHSPSARKAVRVPFGISVHVRWSPQFHSSGGRFPDAASSHLRRR